MPISGLARRSAKALAAAALRHTGLQFVLARASRIAVGGRRILIVSYHRVVEDFDAEVRHSIPGLLLSRSTFERQLDELHRAGFDAVPLGTALEVMAGRLEIPRDAAVLTFDDGYRDVYDCAFPVLRRRGIPAMVFLASGFVGTSERFLHDRLFHLMNLALRASESRGGRNVLTFGAAELAAQIDRMISRRPTRELLEIVARLEAEVEGEGERMPRSGEVLSWPMAREMAKAGIEFGAHTISHIALTHESDEIVEQEVAGSQRAIEEQLGRPVRHFAYPNGHFDARTVASLVRHGFASAVTTEDLPNRIGGDPFRLGRKTLWEDYSRGPFGYSSNLTACHLDDVFTMLGLTRPVRAASGGEERKRMDRPSAR